jgi:antitoxin component of RelBE/YafQ-DinJ toxin-antitoxin module
MKDKQVSIYINDELHEQIKEQAKKMGLTVTAYIRLATIEKINNDK